MDIKSVYSAKNHPDVRKGLKTEDDVLGEFLETFELHHNLRVIYHFSIKKINKYFFYKLK